MCRYQSALTINITATQAFCVISQCLGQIRQAPVFLGRRRKRELDNFIETNELTDNENEYNSKKEDNDNKNHNLPLNNLNKEEQLKIKNTLNDHTINSNDNKINEEELKRKDALIQQEAMDSLNLSAYKSQLATDEREDEVLETTTEIIEFNLNGEQNKYIVKKEVQAVIVDIPDLFDVSYPIAG